MEVTPRSSLSYPSTPSSKDIPYTPHKSSPLAGSFSPTSSPVSAAQARRRSQYKSTAPSSSHGRTAQSSSYAYKTRASSVRTRLFVSGTEGEEEPQRNTLLRERFKARYIERAVRAREQKIKQGRHWGSGPSSDGDADGDTEMEEGDEEDEDFMLNDELFRRIMASAKRKERHQYRVSYQLDVGSSLDPDMEDVEEWERELIGAGEASSTSVPSADIDVEPPDFDDDDEATALAAHAEECDLLEGLDAHADEIFSLSDLDDIDLDSQAQGVVRGESVDVDMS